MNHPRSTKPRPLFKHDVIGSCRTYSILFKQKPQAAITYNDRGLVSVQKGDYKTIL